MSISKTRLNRSVQVNGAIGESGSTGDLGSIGVAACFRFLGVGLAEPETTQTFVLQHACQGIFPEIPSSDIFAIMKKCI
jgi:hypothetical protein